MIFLFREDILTEKKDGHVPEKKKLIKPDCQYPTGNDFIWTNKLMD